MSKVLIIGGSRGIGAEAVRQFKAAGHEVVFTYHRSELDADALRQETGAVPVRCDVKYSDSVRIAVEKAVSVLGQIDVLICNAAIADFNLIHEIEESRWEEIIDTDLNGVFYCIRYVLPSMISRKDGCIITVGSMWGQVGASCEVAYSAAKAGVIGAVKALAVELAKRGITVNAVAPGIIDTDMAASIEEPELVRKAIPMRRFGTCDEVAAVVSFLFREEAAYVTRQVISVNGGLF